MLTWEELEQLADEMDDQAAEQFALADEVDHQAGVEYIVSAAALAHARDECRRAAEHGRRAEIVARSAR